MAAFLVPINKERTSRFKDPSMTLGAYAEHVYIPHKTQGKLKGSTALTST